jgi:hypothetical protein
MFKKTITSLIAVVILGSAIAQNERSHREQNVSIERPVVLHAESTLSNASYVEFGFLANESLPFDDDFDAATSENYIESFTLTVVMISWLLICLIPMITVLIIHFRFQAKNRKWRNSLVTKNGIF